MGRVSLPCFCGNSIAGPTDQERHEENKTRHPQSSGSHIDQLNLLACVRTAAGRCYPKAPCGALTIPFGLGLICRQANRGNPCGLPHCFIKIRYTNFEILFLLIIESSITFNIVKQAALVGFPASIFNRFLVPVASSPYVEEQWPYLDVPSRRAFCCAENWSDDAGGLEAKDARDGKMMTSISASCRRA
jgi:hypothetical protein